MARADGCILAVPNGPTSPVRTGRTALVAGPGPPYAFRGRTRKGVHLMTNQPRGGSTGFGTGGGIAAGAAIGLILGLLLSADLAIMTIAGVVAGLLVGAVVDMRAARS
jgi:hypothetical protein